MKILSTNEADTVRVIADDRKFLLLENEIFYSKCVKKSMVPKIKEFDETERNEHN